ncbi:class I SAM-dependent methyltransferase [Candidatus Woesearchaeota archaeon]|nr:class I SAM-dependent methyltransferase [Candidatus Woesearchaeota archaeon]
MNAEELIKECAKQQDPHFHLTDEKKKAMSEALEMLPQGIEIVDIGHVSDYGPIFEERDMKVISYNLPDDMHFFNMPCKYIIMRHVLEHSPFPLLVLKNLYASLEDSGMVLIILPKSSYWIDEYPYHYTVMSKKSWIHLFKSAGFEVEKVEEGTWTKRKDIVDIEFRFLLKKKLGVEE